jgi:Chemoreceptor zinc-binding domain
VTSKDAIAAHVNWKLRIHALLSGKLLEKLDPTAIAKDDVCELGKWIHSDAWSEMPKPQHSELLATHADFHREAARIVREKYAGHKIGLEAIDSDSLFGKLTTRVVGILSKMAKE